jgi:hypothetical protein
MFPHRRLDEGPFVLGEVSVSGRGKFPVREAKAIYKSVSRIRAKTPAVPTETADLEHLGYEQQGSQILLTAITETEEGTGHLSNLIKRYDLWEGDSFPLPGQNRFIALPVRTVTPVSHRVEPIQLRELSDATEAGLKHDVLSLLRTLDSEIIDMQILSPNGRRPVIYIDYGRSGLIPLSALGDGVRRAFLVALALNSVAGGVLLIDEIEASLHVTALGTLFSWLVRACEKLDIQLFATTHSLEAVDAMIEAEGNNLDLIVGYRLETFDQRVVAQRFDGQMLSRLRSERGLDVRV